MITIKKSINLHNIRNIRNIRNIQLITRVAASLAMLWVTNIAAAVEGKVEHCATPLGTVSVIDAPEGWGHLSAYGLGSPSSLLRLMIQESNCFDVVERGAAFSSLQRERALASSDELQDGSNLGKGQMQAADFILTPNIQIVSNNTGGMGATIGSLGGLFGKTGAVIGGLAAGVKFKEAQTSLLITDVRSGIQVAAAEGSSKKTDFGLGGWASGVGGGGYSNTPEGKMISASLLDNYNNTVIQIRNKPQLIKTHSTSSIANAANSLQATNRRPVTVVHTPQPVPVVPVQATSTSVTTAAIPAPAPVPAPSFVAMMPANYAGALTGSDHGTFAIKISASGQIAGSGNSAKTGRFLITGSLDTSGSLTMNGSGKAAGTSFSGFIDPATGALKGIWSSNKAAVGNGGFTANKL